MKPRLSVHRPFREPLLPFMIAKRGRDVAIIGEQIDPLLDSAVIDHSHIDSMCVFVEEVRYLLVLVDVGQAVFDGWGGCKS